jgi:hypothetical protein
LEFHHLFFLISPSERNHLPMIHGSALGRPTMICES